MFKARLVLMIVLAAFVMAPVQALMLDNMDNIFGAPGVDRLLSPWTDAAGPCWMSQGQGVMKIDFGETHDGPGRPPCIPHPLSGWDYLGNFVGPGGAFGDPALGHIYYGEYDIVPSGDFGGPLMPPNFAPLVATHAFTLDVYKTVAGYSEHVREIQLYDSLGNRNTYSVQSEPLAITVGAGWKTYTIPLSTPLENNADLTDIVTVKLWVSAWSAYVTSSTNPYDPVTQPPEYAAWPPWPEDYTVVPQSGTPVLIDNLRLEQVTVLVPDVYNMTESAAEAVLVAAGLVKGTVTTNYSNIVPVGNVMSQNPLAATSVPIGSSVNLVLSLGGPPLMLDNMDNIFERPGVDRLLSPWTDSTCLLSQGQGVMKIDYGVTNIGSCVPDPLSGYDYLGNFVGPGGSFNSTGGYLGAYDCVPSGDFLLGESFIAPIRVDRSLPVLRYDNNGESGLLEPKGSIKSAHLETLPTETGSQWGAL